MTGAMTRDDFARAVIALQIDPFAFAIDEIDDECYVMIASGDSWDVFYSERGLKTDRRHFASESDALDDLLRRLCGDASARPAGAND